MSHSGVRKRLKVRWMRLAAADEAATAHAFLILKGGTLRDYALCGWPLKSMHLWTADPRHPDECIHCKAGMSKGGRA